MVEQLGVARRLAAQSKIARSATPALYRSSVAIPGSRSPGGQRIVGAGDRTGQFESTTASSERLPILAGQSREELPGHRLTRIARIAANKNVRLDRFRRIGQRHHVRPARSAPPNWPARHTTSSSLSSELDRTCDHDNVRR